MIFRIIVVMPASALRGEAKARQSAHHSSRIPGLLKLMSGPRIALLLNFLLFHMVPRTSTVTVDCRAGEIRSS